MTAMIVKNQMTRMRAMMTKAMKVTRMMMMMMKMTIMMMTTTRVTLMMMSRYRPAPLTWSWEGCLSDHRADDNRPSPLLNNPFSLHTLFKTAPGYEGTSTRCDWLPLVGYQLLALTVPKLWISQAEALFTVMIFYDIKSLTWYPTISWTVSKTRSF